MFQTEYLTLYYVENIWLMVNVGNDFVSGLGGGKHCDMSSAEVPGQP